MLEEASRRLTFLLGMMSSVKRAPLDTRKAEQRMLASALWKDWKAAGLSVNHNVDCTPLVVDNAHDAINIAIILKNSGRFAHAEQVNLKILDVAPAFAPAFHELALVLRYQNRHWASLKFAKRAYELERSYKYTLVTQMCVCGLTDEAESIVYAADWTTQSSNEEDRIHAEFARFMAKYPLAAAEAAIRRIAESGSYLDVEGVERRITTALGSKQPFAFTRLGDGEGAWTFLSREDECRYGSLYRMCRLSFLRDWFGSQELIDDEGFFQFAIKCSERLQQSDIVGITDIPRLRHEYRLVSTRGIPTSINVLRSQGVLDGPPNANESFCSNNIHYELNARGFFSKLFSQGAKIGLITSHPGLQEKLSAKGANVVFAHLTPGDSRNFWQGADGRTLCQYPDVFRQIYGDLQSKDMQGLVVLVAAGFVGKQYLAAVRQRGGVALDIGGVADQWIRATD